MSGATSSSRLGPTLALASGGTFLAFLDTTVTNLAIPSVAETFDVGVTDVSWMATAYVIAFAALLAPAGALADALGRARLFLAGVGVFTAASLVIAVAPSFAVLVSARAVQGLGAALMVPASLSLVVAAAPPARMRAAIGLWSASGALAAAVGPALGGITVEAVSWRALFCLNLPIGLWILVAARRLTADDQRQGRAPDLIGSVLLGLAIASLVYGLTEGPEEGWTAGRVVGAFVLAALSTVATVARAAAHPRPALRMDLWRNRPFAATTGVSVAYGLSLFTTMLLGVLLLVDVWQYSALEAGLAVTPAALSTAVVGVGIGRLSLAITPRAMVVVGSLLVGGTTAVLAGSISAEPHFLALWLPTGLVMGVGVGLVTVGISSAAAASVAPQHFSAATGLVMAARQLGGALGIATMAVLLVEVGHDDPVTPYAAVYWLVTAVNVAAAAGAVLLRARPPEVLPEPPVAGSDAGSGVQGHRAVDHPVGLHQGDRVDAELGEV